MGLVHLTHTISGEASLVRTLPSERVERGPEIRWLLARPPHTLPSDTDSTFCLKPHSKSPITPALTSAGEVGPQLTPQHPPPPRARASPQQTFFPLLFGS